MARAFVSQGRARAAISLTLPVGHSRRHTSSVHLTTLQVEPAAKWEMRWPWTSPVGEQPGNEQTYKDPVVLLAPAVIVVSPISWPPPNHNLFTVRCAPSPGAVVRTELTRHDGVARSA